MKAHDKIAISTKSGRIVLKLRDIMYFERKGTSTIVYTRFNEKHLALKSMEYFESLLGRYNFMRSQNVYLINMEPFRAKYHEAGAASKNLIDNLMMLPKKMQSVYWSIL